MKTREQKLVILLLGFLSGNLFGTILDFLRRFLVWDVLIITVLLLAGEAISYMSYNKTLAPWLTKMKSNQAKRKTPFKIDSKKAIGFTILTLQPYLNFFKIGVMIGFFVDSFKVGS